MDRRPDWERRLLAGCDAAQVAAITSAAAPLLVVAGAGSGKTRVLTRRIAWRVLSGSATAGHVLALTFTRKAAAELRARLGELGLPAPVTAGTFHALALAELRRRAAECGRPAPVVLESKARLLAAVLPDQGAPARRAPGGRTPDRRALLAALAAEIEWAKARCVAPGDYAAEAFAARRQPPLDLEEVAGAYGAYETARRRRRVVDFDDLLRDLTEEIERDPDFAAAQRWRFAHLFVDELQDANAAQLRLLDAWRGGRADLFAVGDPRQAIYGWNGADPSGVLRFTERFPGATVLALDTNYRSSPEVVACAAAVLATDTPDQLAAPRSGRPEGSVPTLRRYDDDAAEAAGVAASVRIAHRPGRRWSQCAVLARTNAQLLVLEEALRAAGVPVRTAAGTGLFARPHVRAVFAELDPHAPGAGLRAFLEHLAALGDGTPEGDDTDEGRAATDTDVADDFAALARLGVEYLGIDPAGTAEGYLAFARQALREDPAHSERDAVELATFHRAKGLEWSVVFVTGLEDGYVPSARATTASALAEERRLLYVALSRAEDELHCSWSAQRRFGSHAVERAPSPWLSVIETTCRRLAAATTPRPADARAHLAATRALLHDVMARQQH
jgi:DNA helicase-2/ATP-dependent DNA helicase PcrA